ncbi:hypothetical protein SAMN04515666_101314 [Bosea lupini]|uniref:Uncharacterized protein n=1 Tax=Bosea lupini TaxID=1036779 RepID=A0A1H7GC23_9HYPH|nr:hypothetical protein [Bosea lupini]SEK35671.1 hypothetical protein SAMN04515666_101314 [Bosea lupini]
MNWTALLPFAASLFCYVSAERRWRHGFRFPAAVDGFGYVAFAAFTASVLVTP